MHNLKYKPESFLSPSTPVIVRSKRSAAKISPPSSVRSNLFQSITDNDGSEDVQFHCSSPNLTPMTHANPQYYGDALDSKMLLLSSDLNSFGNFVDEFTMIGVVGMGAFSEVCKVDSKRKPGNFFALKRCNKIFRSEGDRDRMLAEARTLKLLNESHDTFLPKFYSAWQENGFLYMLVEYAEYGSVHDIIQKHGSRKLRVPDGFLWWTMHDVLQGLQAIHAAEHVHLDIKPANLLIFQGWVVKLSDFGMSTRIGASKDDKEGDSRYMAKELLNDPNRLPSADIFSLGITLYEIASIHTMEPASELDGILGRPLSLPTEGEGWHQLRDGAAPPLLNRPSTMAHMIQAMLHPVPDQRPTASQLLLVPEVIYGRQQIPYLQQQNQSRGQEQILIDAIIPRPVINRSSSFEPDMFKD